MSKGSTQQITDAEEAARTLSAAMNNLRTEWMWLLFELIHRKRFERACANAWFTHRARQKWRIPGIHYPWIPKRKPDPWKEARQQRPDLWQNDTSEGTKP